MSTVTKTTQAKTQTATEPPSVKINGFTQRDHTLIASALDNAVQQSDTASSSTGHKLGSDLLVSNVQVKTHSASDLNIDDYYSQPVILPFGKREQPVTKAQFVNRMNAFQHEHDTGNSEFELSTAECVGNADKKSGSWCGTEDRNVFSSWKDAVSGAPRMAGGVFDGHGGKETAVYASKNLDRVMQETFADRTAGQTDSELFTAA